MISGLLSIGMTIELEWKTDKQQAVKEDSTRPSVKEIVTLLSSYLRLWENQAPIISRETCFKISLRSLDIVVLKLFLTWSREGQQQAVY